MRRFEVKPQICDRQSYHDKQDPLHYSVHRQLQAAAWRGFMSAVQRPETRNGRGAEQDAAPLSKGAGQAPAASRAATGSEHDLRATFGCANGMRRADLGDLRFRITDGATRWPARSTHRDVHVWRYLALVQFDRSDRTSHMSENDENCSRCKHPMSQHEIESDASENDDSEHEARGACEVRTCFCPRFSAP
jgi:hypothetical protein